ncbi:MAG: alpha/beta fold hydrolase [Vulcanimicrobiaceae bacterium]
MQVLSGDGARIAARVDGTADAAVVLLHGFPLTREIWKAQIEGLARTRRVVAVDLRGMGESSVADGPYLMESLAGDVAAVLDAIGVERAAVVGHSLGGYVALAFARMYSERLERLALVCSRLGADAPEQAQTRMDLADCAERESSVEPVIAAYAPRLLSDKTRRERPELLAAVEAIARRNGPRGLAAMLRGMALRDDAYDIAPDLAMPVRLICGARDGLLPVELVRSDASAFSNAAVDVLEDSGHLPMLEEPEAFGERLAAFVNEGPGASPSA